MIIIYAGRFQPPHTGHYEVYKWACKKFGEENVWIATSNRKDEKRSPFGFHTKRFLWNYLFGIPCERIIQTKNPAYDPEEIPGWKNKTAVFVVSKKDEQRYLGYLERLPEKIEDIEENEKYFIVVPVLQNNISSTMIRNLLKENNHEKLENIYGKKYHKLIELWNKEKFST